MGRTRLVSLMCAVVLTAILAACSSAATHPASVGRFASENPGSVNTYWLRVPRGLVIVDAGRNETGGRQAAAEIRRTGEPVLAILITHPHPDHVGGLGVLHREFPQAPIYASEATANWMRTDPLMFYQLARRDDADYPAELTIPDRIVTPGASLDIGGAWFQTAELGAGESETATVYYEPSSGALFAGDLTNNRATPALLEGQTCGWLTNLDRLSDLFPNARTVYSGHGASGELREQLDAQRAYLHRFRGLVRPAVGADSPAGQTVTPDEQRAIIAELDRAYPNYPLVASLTTLKEENVKGVARELQAEDPTTLPPACRDR